MNEQTLEKLRSMKLTGMYRSFRQVIEAPDPELLTADELVAKLVDTEWDERKNRNVQRTLRNAKFRYKASVEQLDLSEKRGLDKNLILRLADCEYIRQSKNVIITGSTGTGKSFLASALGNQACSMGFRVLYANTMRMFAQLKMAKADGSILKELPKIEKMDLLILDDFGIQPFDAQSRSILMDIIEDRHGKRSTLFVGQVPVEAWYDIIGDETLADAILDRVVHDAHKLELSGESLRRTRKSD